MNHDRFFTDAHAFVRWCIKHDKVALIVPTLAHDFAGVINREECFSPRITGYAALENAENKVKA